MPKGDGGHRTTSITGALRPVIDAYGGVIKFAQALLVSRRTVLRWGRGESTPDPEMQARINSWARVAKVKEPYVKGRLRGARRNDG